MVRLGYADHGKKRFNALFRPDNHPSCEIWNDQIVDRSTNERMDAITLFARHYGISDSEAIKRLAAELPSKDLYQPRPAVKPQTHKLVIPPMHYSKEEAAAVAKSRSLTPHSTEMAGVFHGTLGFASVAGFPCWLLTDGQGKVAEARRMDGQKFPAIGSLGERKIHTLRGSCKSWPLGITPPKIKRIPSNLRVLLVEGGPDYLAACDLLAVVHPDFLPVAMLGAGQGIHADALPFFKGREVRIIAHPDESGRDAAKRWRSQLVGVGASVTAVQLEGGDLNDMVKLHGAEAVAGGLL